MAASYGKLESVVIAVDGSEESMSALRWALDNLRLSSGDFIVLHAQPPPSITAGISPAAIPFGGPSHVDVPAFAAAIEAHQRRVSEAILSHALKICAEKDTYCVVEWWDTYGSLTPALKRVAKRILGLCCTSSSCERNWSAFDFVSNVKTEVVVGEPKETICNYVANKGADLLVMGSRAYGTIKRMFLGSVSNYCINNVQCPVVVIKGSSQT